MRWPSTKPRKSATRNGIAALPGRRRRPPMPGTRIRRGFITPSWSRRPVTGIRVPSSPRREPISRRTEPTSAGGAAAPRAARDVGAGGDDDRGAEPGPRVRKIPEDRVAEDGRADQLDIPQRRDNRRWSVLERADHQVMPGAAEQAEAAEQQNV